MSSPLLSTFLYNWHYLYCVILWWFLVSDSFYPLFILSVPQGSETAWLYNSSEGQRQLAASANFRRLLIVTMHRNQEYTDMQAVQSELSPMVMDLAPPGMPANQQVNTNAYSFLLYTVWKCLSHQYRCSSALIWTLPIQVPFLSVGGDLGWREEVSRGVSELSGEYCVENVKGEDGELYRRLVFLSNAALVQSESRLISSNTSAFFIECTLICLLFFELIIFSLWSSFK